MCLFLFFLFIDLYFLISEVIKQILNAIAELAIPIGIQTKEAKAEMGTHPVIVEITIRECSIQLKTLHTFLCFSLINSFQFIFSVK